MKKILTLILVICVIAVTGCSNKTTENDDIIEQESEENITKENEQMTEPMKTEFSETDKEPQNMNVGNNEVLKEDNITGENDYTVNTDENEKIIEDMPITTDLTDNKALNEEHGNDNERQNAEKTVTISIEGPEDVGAILESTIVVFEDDDTVFDVTKRITREKKIHFSFRGSGPMTYVEGIDNLYEFDRGATSGWLYSVNGNYYGKGCATYKVSDGDVIMWAYTLDLGKDLGAPN